MQEYCQCHRHNPDDRLRNAERQVQATDDPADWDRYLSELDRAGLLVTMLSDIETTLPRQGLMIPLLGGGQAVAQPRATVGGPVTEEQAILLMRVLGYQYRAGLIDFNELGRWETESIRQVILRQPRNSSSKMPYQLKGYYWVRYTPPVYYSPIATETGGPCDCSLDTLMVTGCQQALHQPRRFYPIRVLSSQEAQDRKVSHRVLLLCPVCQKEMPAGRLSQHFAAHRVPRDEQRN